MTFRQNKNQGITKHDEHTRTRDRNKNQGITTKKCKSRDRKA
jgi:hypothetical protein